MMISARDSHFMQKAWEVAGNSSVQCAHVGCVAVTNGKITATGNNSYRTHSHNGLLSNVCSCHAEMAVVNDLLKKYGNGGHWERSLKGA